MGEPAHEPVRLMLAGELVVARERSEVVRGLHEPEP